MRFLFKTPSYLKSADWLTLLSPLGAYVVECTTLAPAYKRLFQQFLIWGSAVRARDFTVERIAQLIEECYELMTDMEILLPAYCATINQHMLIHLVRRILTHGPLHTNDMSLSLLLILFLLFFSSYSFSSFFLVFSFRILKLWIWLSEVGC